jgi:ATP-binding cassette subfamily D (ALD) protein 3
MCRGVGDLILVYKRMASLASHTSRVSELLEQVMALSAEDAEHKELFLRNVSTGHIPSVLSASRLGECGLAAAG